MSNTNKAGHFHDQQGWEADTSAVHSRASISVRCWLQSLSFHSCRFMNINRCHIRISRHPCCCHLCRDELNTAQYEGVHSLPLNQVLVHDLCLKTKTMESTFGNWTLVLSRSKNLISRSQDCLPVTMISGHLQTSLQYGSKTDAYVCVAGTVLKTEYQLITSECL